MLSSVQYGNVTRATSAVLHFVYISLYVISLHKHKSRELVGSKAQPALTKSSQRFHIPSKMEGVTRVASEFPASQLIISPTSHTVFCAGNDNTAETPTQLAYSSKQTHAAVIYTLSCWCARLWIVCNDESFAIETHRYPSVRPSGINVEAVDGIFVESSYSKRTNRC